MAKGRFTIAVDSTRSFSSVISELTAIGFTPERELADLGIVVGTCEAGLAARLHTVSGVLGVEPESWVSVPPPNDKLQ